MLALESYSSSMPQVEELGIVEKLIHSICVKTCTDLSLVGWPIPKHQNLLQGVGVCYGMESTLVLVLVLVQFE